MPYYISALLRFQALLCFSSNLIYICVQVNHFGVLGALLMRYREHFFSILWWDDFNEILTSRAVRFLVDWLVILTLIVKMIKVIFDGYFSSEASKIAINSFLENVHVLIVL